MKRLLLIIVCIVAYGCSWSIRKALIVGNTNYSDNPLTNSANDASAIDKMLKKVGFNTTLLLNLSKRSFDDAINAFSASLNDNDEAIFYYSGHGVQIDGENYLIP